MKKTKVCVLRTAGTNCDKETGFAFSKVGAVVDFIHINKLVSGAKKLEEYHILAIPGGFSYGDDLGAGKILANELRFKLSQDVKKFIEQGKLIIGICNGFQILVKSGLLPGNDGLKQEASLIINDSAKFEDRWVYLKLAGQRVSGSAGLPVHPLTNRCVWVKDLPEIIYLPVAHGEGKFVAKDKKTLERLRKNNQIVFQYCDAKGGFAGYPDNPNGSEEHIAGICDESGKILGLMPHPERHMDTSQHPRHWNKYCEKKEGDGLSIFRNGVEHVRRYL